MKPRENVEERKKEGKKRKTKQKGRDKTGNSSRNTFETRVRVKFNKKNSYGAYLVKVSFSIRGWPGLGNCSKGEGASSNTGGGEL